MWYIYNLNAEFNDIIKSYFDFAEAKNRKSHRKSRIENTDILRLPDRKPIRIPLIFLN